MAAAAAAAAAAGVLVGAAVLWALSPGPPPLGRDLEAGSRGSGGAAGAGGEPSGEFLPGTAVRDLAAGEPYVRLARNFLSAAECDHLRALVEPRVPFSRGVNVTIGAPGPVRDVDEAEAANFFAGGAEDPVRTARGHPVPRRYDRVVATVEARAARLAGLPENHGEPLQVWRYDEGQHWTAHHDCVPRNEGAMENWGVLGGQRVVTVLLYIGEPEAGGETVFPERSDWAAGAAAEGLTGAGVAGGFSECARAGGVVAARPRLGDALAFKGVLGEGASAATSPDALATHLACPVLRGTKWVAAKWFREGPHNADCWEAARRGGDGGGGEPGTLRLSAASRKKFMRSQLYCHESEVGKPPAPPLEISVPADIRIDFGELAFKRRLGNGAFGEVVLASWRGRDVAAKVILPDHASSAAFVEDFAQEARIQAPLRHPNVVRLLGVSTVAPDLCLVMELAERGNLLGVLEARNAERRRGGELAAAGAGDLPQRLGWALDVARGLSYLHSQQPAVIHRDLKPPQILVDGNWSAKLADFGLAATTEDIARERAGPEPPLPAGTSTFMAPEVLRGGPCSARSDTFSFGVTLFQILSGENPYERHDAGSVGAGNQLSMSEMRERVVIRGERPRSQAPLPGPPALHRVMEACWAADPAQRPSMAEVAAQLEALLQSLPAGGGEAAEVGGGAG